MCVCVNAIRTILQFTLVTHGHLFGVKLGATKGTNIPIITHNILIIIVLLCRCGPYMCRNVFPCTIWRVPYLSSNQKLLQMQEYTHVLMQLRTGSPRGATQQSVDCESLTPTQGATQQSVDCESLTPTRGATQQSVDCESLTPTRGATQQSVDCESLTPTRGATQQSVDSKIVLVSSIAPEGWGPKEGGNATSHLHSRGSPTKGDKIRSQNLRYGSP